MTKADLIRELIIDGYLKTPAIIKAFNEIDRIDFVPISEKNSAYENRPVFIGCGQTISQPLVVAFMLEILEPKPGEKILDVGAGSGWQTALLAYLVGRKGKVIAIERIEELFKFARENINHYNFFKKGIVKLILGDGSKELVEEAPFDKIISGASADQLPTEWKKQLKIGGKIVAPVKQSIVLVNKTDENVFKEKEFFGFSFVPLVKD